MRECRLHFRWHRVVKAYGDHRKRPVGDSLQSRSRIRIQHCHYLELELELELKPAPAPAPADHYCAVLAMPEKALYSRTPWYSRYPSGFLLAQSQVCHHLRVSLFIHLGFLCHLGRFPYPDWLADVGGRKPCGVAAVLSHIMVAYFAESADEAPGSEAVMAL